jgi:hypothetical protein
VRQTNLAAQRIGGHAALDRTALEEESHHEADAEAE